MTADVPEAAQRLNACQHRLQAANDRLWSGLHPDALGLVYDGAAAVGQGSSQVAEGIVDAVRAGGSAAEVEASVLGELQEVHWTFTARSQSTSSLARTVGIWRRRSAS